jgi:Beta-lactamase enzyme family
MLMKWRYALPAGVAVVSAGAILLVTAQGHSASVSALRKPAAGSPTPTATPLPTRTPMATPTPAFTDQDRARLTKALKRYLATREGQASVAIRDLYGGDTFTYNTALRTATASIVKVDILAALLLRYPHLSDAQRALAAGMIEQSDNNAATALWQEIGSGPGLTAANARMGLKDTIAGPGGYWGSTSTSAFDQLRILNALTSKRSPLTAAARRYALGLMSKVEDAQAWGVSAGASDGDTVSLKNGWLPRTSAGGKWTVNSIGRIHGDAHDFLIAVISQGHSSMATGITTIEHVSQLVTDSLD